MIRHLAVLFALTDFAFSQGPERALTFNTATQGIALTADPLTALGLDATVSRPVRISNTNGYLGWTVGQVFAHDGVFYCFYMDLTFLCWRVTSTDGESWGEPTAVLFDDTEDKSRQVSAVGVDENGRFWAIAGLIEASYTSPASSYTIFKSDDDGVTWSSWKTGVGIGVPVGSAVPNQFTSIVQFADGQMASVWAHDATQKTGLLKWDRITDETGDDATLSSMDIASDRASDAQIWSDNDAAVIPLRYDESIGGATTPKVAVSTNSGASWSLSDLPNAANGVLSGSALGITRKGDKYIICGFYRYSHPRLGSGMVYLWTADAKDVIANPTTAGSFFTLAQVGEINGNSSGEGTSMTGQGGLAVSGDRVLMTFSSPVDEPGHVKTGDVFGITFNFARDRVRHPLVTRSDIALARERRLPTTILDAQSTTKKIPLHPNTRYILLGSSANYVTPSFRSAVGDVIEVVKGASPLELRRSGKQHFILSSGLDLGDSDYRDGSPRRGTVRLTFVLQSGGDDYWLVDNSGARTEEVVWALDKKASGTNGGAAGAGAVTVTRDLQTLVDPMSLGFCSIVNNAVRLVPGEYIIRAEVPSYSAGRHAAQIYNSTTSSPVPDGHGTAMSSSSDTTVSVIEVWVAPSVRTDYTIRQYFNDAPNAATDLGMSAGGAEEIYTKVRISRQ